MRMEEEENAGDTPASSVELTLQGIRLQKAEEEAGEFPTADVGDETSDEDVRGLVTKHDGQSGPCESCGHDVSIVCIALVVCLVLIASVTAAEWRSRLKRQRRRVAIFCLQREGSGKVEEG